MKNKNGFTLVELIVSIVLVSVVLVALVGSLLQLRSAYSVVHENSDVIVYTSSIWNIQLIRQPSRPQLWLMSLNLKQKHTVKILI